MVIKIMKMNWSHFNHLFKIEHIILSFVFQNRLAKRIFLFS
jgi:hypothetical protein